MIKQVQLSQLVDIVSSPINPQNSPNDLFDLFSIPAYDNGMYPDVCEGSAIKSNKTVVNPGNVLFSKLNPRIPRVWLVPESTGSKQICSTEFVPLRCRDKTQLNPGFLKYMVLAPQFLSPIQAAANSSTRSHQRIKPATILEQRIPLPSLPEQQRIVKQVEKFLSCIDEIKRLRVETQREAEAIFPAILSAIFDDVKNKCCLSTVDDVTRETRYGTSQKCHTNADGLPILRIPNVANGEINRDDLKYCNLAMRDHKKLLLQDGDILIVRTNGSPDLVGRCAVVTLHPGEEFGFASYLIRIRVDRKKVNPQFLAYFLTSTHGRTAIENIRRTAAGQYNINSENIRAITLPLPSMDIQNDLVVHMDAQHIISKHLYKEQIDLAMNEGYLVQSVLSKAFAGEL